MGRPRKFDHDLARVMHEEGGVTIAELAREFGVSDFAIDYAVHAETRDRCQTRQRELRTWITTCIDCGGPATKAYPSSRDPHNGRCRPCHAATLVTSVRPDTLRCCDCEEWKPDEAFTVQRGRLARRNRAAECKECMAARKRRERANWSQERRAVESRKKLERERARRQVAA